MKKDMYKTLQIEDGIIRGTYVMFDKSERTIDITREQIVQYLSDHHKPRLIYGKDGRTILPDRDLAVNYATILDREYKQSIKDANKDPNEPPKRGGFREGSGRKPKDVVITQSVTLKLRKDFLEIITKNFPNRSDFIQRAIKEKLKRDGFI